MSMGQEVDRWTFELERQIAHVQDGQGKLARRIESLEMRGARLMYRIDKLEERLEMLERKDEPSFRFSDNGD